MSALSNSVGERKSDWTGRQRRQIVTGWYDMIKTKAAVFSVSSVSRAEKGKVKCLEASQRKIPCYL